MSVMKLAVFGATGRTGQHLVRQALDGGHQVVALVRNRDKLDAAGFIEGDRLTLVQGDLSDTAAVDRVVAGVDAVLSVLGPISNQPTFEVSLGIKHILGAMQRHGVSRIIISAGAGVHHPGDSPKLFDRMMHVLVKTTAKNVYRDMLKSVDLVRTSDLDWTVVRVPMLTDDPPTGHIRVGMVGDGMGLRLSRADLAGYILQLVQGDEQVHKAPAISN